MNGLDNNKRLDAIVESLSVDDLGYIVKNVLMKRESVYYGQRKKLNKNEDFVMVTIIDKNDSEYTKRLSDLMDDIWNNAPEDFERNYIYK